MASLAALAAALEQSSRRAGTVDDLAREVGASRSEVELGLLMLERLGRVRRDMAGADCAPGSAACAGCPVRTPCQAGRSGIASYSPIRATSLEKGADVQS